MPAASSTRVAQRLRMPRVARASLMRARTKWNAIKAGWRNEQAPQVAHLFAILLGPTVVVVGQDTETEAERARALEVTRSLQDALTRAMGRARELQRAQQGNDARLQAQRAALAQQARAEVARAAEAIRGVIAPVPTAAASVARDAGGAAGLVAGGMGMGLVLAAGALLLLAGKRR